MAQDQAGGGGDLMPGEPPALKEAQHIRRATPVQSAEHDMATGSRFRNGLSRDRIPHLTHKDDVGIQAEDGFDADGKIKPLGLVNSDLRDSIHGIFHGVIQGDDGLIPLADFMEQCIKRGGLAGPGGSRSSRTNTCPPGGVNFIALLARLSRICRKRSSSSHSVEGTTGAATT